MVSLLLMSPIEDKNSRPSAKLNWCQRSVHIKNIIITLHACRKILNFGIIHILQFEVFEIFASHSIAPTICTKNDDLLSYYVRVVCVAC